MHMQINRPERRKFLQQLAGLTLLAGLDTSWVNKQNPLRLSFSTLGCPNWNFDQILSFATRFKYQGIEFRGLLEELDLYKCPEFNTSQQIRLSSQKLMDKGLTVVCLGTSVVLHEAAGSKREEHFDKAKKFIDLASALNCKAIRVFPDKMPPERSKADNQKIMAESWIQLCAFAKGTDVAILMETHGELLLSEDIVELIKQVPATNAALVWDMANMWSKTKEPVKDMYQNLKPYIKHTHIKDLILEEENIKDVFIGKGQSPVFEALQLLHQDAYAGFYSFEWEKRWHPELADPELALADYVRVMGSRFQ